MKLRLLALIAALLSPMAVVGHEVRPAYLAIQEDAPGEFTVVWKTPMIGEMRLALDPEISGLTETLTPTATRMTGSAAVQTSRLRVDDLRGRTVRVKGLEHTMTDALVRVVFNDNSSWVQRLTPQQPQAVVPARPSGWTVAGTYLGLGVEHILLGVDHLLFVLALLAARRPERIGAGEDRYGLHRRAQHHAWRWRRSASCMSRRSRSRRSSRSASCSWPREIVRSASGRTWPRCDVPWHRGLRVRPAARASASPARSSEVGLPEGHIPVALLFFNLGVEAGQLVFVAVVLSIIGIAGRLRAAWPRWTTMAPPYAIGSVASFWMIERVAAF